MEIFILDDDLSLREMLEEYFLRKGHRVKSFSTGGEFLNSELSEADLFLLDIKLPDISGIDVLAEMRKRGNISAPVIMMSAYADRASALEAIRMGAADYIQKPFDLNELEFVIDKVLERERLIFEKNFYRSRFVPEEHEFIPVGESKVMKKILSDAERIAPFKTSVLITGESGVGKEVIAKYIYMKSGRRDKAFIPINCGAIPSELMESELFGYEKGAFTGAHSRKKGLLEVADGGTVFFDEIAELPLNLQVKLLRVIQDSTFIRVGGTYPVKIDIRIISATSKNLEEEIKKGKFREDLFYRLNVFHIHIPPLRERKEDILPLLEFFVKKFSREFRKNIKGFTDKAKELILNHPWYGNVRELENMVERAIILCEEGWINEEFVEFKDFKESSKSLSQELMERDEEISLLLKEIIDKLNGENFSLKDITPRVEKYLIMKGLKKTKGNVLKASKILDVSHRALIYKIRDYRLEEFVENLRKKSEK